MRLSAFLLPPSLLGGVAAAIQLPDFQPFLAALSDYLPQQLQNDTAHDLLKRQYSNTCPTGFNSCDNLGAPSLCCMSSAICSADSAGHVACCPSGAACTGTIGGVISSGTIGSNGALVGGGAAAATTTTSNGALAGSAATTTTSFQFASTATSNNGLVAATTAATVATGGGTTGNGFIVAGSSTVATPGAAMRRAEVPALVHAIVYVLEFLPIW
ncbi:Hypothetical predicted protein [Lecanosticta acicola]|uniref:GPI anchored protein n=1 Tax=Lecanosticta acicola TaxID=111012 RepID=A0AAI8Z041_9PEZI|nr:Hypothetical predicted protein [Lecanosticta acicola]